MATIPGDVLGNPYGSKVVVSYLTTLRPNHKTPQL